ncbi:hypothetical protein [Methanocaldococcus sp. FS406-22]|uniref:hypothetical protein n=1 Tax=Methanocaldococcus sp. (strain FS406-22) TaxID=644281 RepID=UPI001E286343|nr:hypothetical protein [Methanocaldococcus sp. FS406-22]
MQLPFILIKYLVGCLNSAPLGSPTLSSSQLIIEIISTVVSAFVGFYTAVFSKRQLYYITRIELKS